jgi:TolB-like protein/DNA-binding winged helix-turn-helix (wHTH) protein/tetratricopeptide (TPR) repeat protein
LERQGPASETNPVATTAYSFGAFVLDRGRGLLLRDGREVPLRPKSFDVLTYLLQHPGQVVSRAELLEAAWPGLVVTDDSLTQCLIEIRKALGDDDRALVRTVPRRGYLFDLPVATVEAAYGETSATPAPTHPAPGGMPRRPSLWTLVALAVLALALGATWWRAGQAPGSTAEQPAGDSPAAASIAVLPFADMSPDGGQEYLADGIAEEILNLLAQVPELTVIARTSSFSFKGQQVDAATIGRRLNVANLLEGSLRKDGDRIRITAQLVDSASGAHIWSQTYDDRLQDVFALQDRIASEVTRVIQVELLGALPAAGDFFAHAPGPPDPRAWEHYLRGRHFYGRRMSGDLLRAQEHFQQALAIDPGLAAAWVALAATYSIRQYQADLPEKLRLPNEVADPLVREALANALALDPDNPEALLRMSRYAWLEGDAQTALEQSRRAMQLGRNNALVQSMLAGRALRLGEPAIAAALQERAVALDPVSAVHHSNLAAYHFAAGNLAAAREAWTRSIELNPELLRRDHELDLGLAILMGENDSALEQLDRLQPGPLRDQALAMLAYAAGDPASADQAVQRLRQLPVSESGPRLAEIYAQRGEVTEAMNWLHASTAALVAEADDRAARDRLVELQSSPFLRPLHDDPRWAAWAAETRIAWWGEADRELLLMLRHHLASTAAPARVDS